MPLQKPSKEIQWNLRKFPLIVIVENIHSPSNVGLIIRTCECFGVKKLIFTGEYSNVHTSRFRRITRAAEKYIEVCTEADAVSTITELREMHYKLIALEIADTSSSLKEFDFLTCEKIALVIGSERHGISEVTLQQADNCIHINQYGRTGSLNVSMALSIALYEITRQFS